MLYIAVILQILSGAKSTTHTHPHWKSGTAFGWKPGKDAEMNLPSSIAWIPLQKDTRESSTQLLRHARDNILSVLGEENQADEI